MTSDFNDTPAVTSGRDLYDPSCRPAPRALWAAAIPWSTRLPVEEDQSGPLDRSEYALIQQLETLLKKGASRVDEETVVAGVDAAIDAWRNAAPRVGGPRRDTMVSALNRMEEALSGQLEQWKAIDRKTDDQTAQHPFYKVMLRLLHDCLPAARRLTDIRDRAGAPADRLTLNLHHILPRSAYVLLAPDGGGAPRQVTHLVWTVRDAIPDVERAVQALETIDATVHVVVALSGQGRESAQLWSDAAVRLASDRTVVVCDADNDHRPWTFAGSLSHFLHGEATGDFLQADLRALHTFVAYGDEQRMALGVLRARFYHNRCPVNVVRTTDTETSGLGRTVCGDLSVTLLRAADARHQSPSLHTDDTVLRWTQLQTQLQTANDILQRGASPNTLFIRRRQPNDDDAGQRRRRREEEEEGEDQPMSQRRRPATAPSASVRSRRTGP